MGKRDKDRTNAKPNPYLRQARSGRACRKNTNRATISTLPTVKDEYFYEDESAKRNEKNEGIHLNNSIKSEYIEEDKSEEEEYLPSMKKDDSSSSSISKPNTDYEPILSSQTYSSVSQIDFRIFLDSVSRSKVYSVMLVDRLGRVIFSDKLGHELFQGSLNNFQTLRIQNLLLKTLKDSTLGELRRTKVFTRNTIFNWIIYSKNTKRRYCRVPFSNSRHSFDTFFRFLKVLSIRFRPVRAQIDDFRSIEGFWNPGLVYNELKDCFLLEVKLCHKLPQISPEALWKDPLLNKYIQINSKKAEAWANEPNSEGQPIEKQSDSSDFSLSSERRKPAQKKGKRKLQFRKSTVKLEQKRQQKESSGVRLFTEIFIEDI